MAGSHPGPLRRHPRQLVLPRLRGAQGRLRALQRLGPRALVAVERLLATPALQVGDHQPHDRGDQAEGHEHREADQGDAADRLERAPGVVERLAETPAAPSEAAPFDVTSTDTVAKRPWRRTSASSASSASAVASSESIRDRAISRSSRVSARISSTSPSEPVEDARKLALGANRASGDVLARLAARDHVAELERSVSVASSSR